MVASALLPGEKVIDHENLLSLELAVPPGQSKGYQQRNRLMYPTGFSAHETAFNLDLIPRSKWPDLIAAKEANGTNSSAVVLNAGIPSKDQNGTNYCWCNAVVTAFETARCLANEPYHSFSPASVAAPIRSYRNQGGWGGEALDYIVKNGICPADDWPVNAIQSSYDTAASRQSRAKYKIVRWLDLDPNNFDQVATCLLNGIPVCAGLDWWSHEVCFMDLVNLGNGQFGVRFRNSWGDSYGSKGFNVLTEAKSLPADACATQIVSAAA